MSQAITISAQDILHQVKLSCQIPSIVEQIVTRKIIINAAAEAGIKVEAEELQQAADNIRLISKLKTADETWEWLKKNCLSLDDFEEMVYTNVISGKLAQHLFAYKVEPWFVEHQLDYAGAVIYEVVLDDEDLAMELFYALQEGEMSFPEVAHQYIQDTELRRRGGYRGVVRRNEMKPEISAAVFAAKPPQVLKPIVGAKGVYLILVEEVIKPQLDEKLRYQILSDLFQKWMRQKVDEMKATINIAFDT
ncbi:peptidylprolyl isomerase [Planktothrix sp. FACHB-1355]|uniref:Peptidylprolyl isomerase n=1 Tax=Aerosakkonema funiforme FACHB-1375 TaxID=2949571 RepID=A0A926ZF75_9CYAN|nr:MULTISPECIES: peptidylprolyl isomerase [Oscillatoriales]MBD2180575.1 peptidylprolyl isomerase [Aerosakkonema funiforme FACHB-1375]MBD3559936.1 peptidylprolyl isomerase [Planktothrix sp. FACHB-1355]